MVQVESWCWRIELHAPITRLPLRVFQVFLPQAGNWGGLHRCQMAA